MPAVATTATRSPRRKARQVFSPAGIIGTVIVGFWIVMAILAPMILSEQADTFDTGNSLQGPSADHLLGTDALGRDVLARVLVATRLTFVLSFGAVVIGMVLGIALGILAAVLGNAARRVLYQFTAAAMAFPSIIMAMLLATLIGRSGYSAMLGLAIASVPSTARLVLNLTSTVAGMDYVAAARMLGVRRARLMWRHVMPNIAEPVVTLLVVTMGANLMMMAAMSFLGIGVQLPEYDWGGMISEAMKDIYSTPWITIGPAVAIVTAGIGFSLIGERLAQFIDPRSLAVLPQPRSRRRGRAVKTRTAAAAQPARPAVAVPSDAVAAVSNLHVYAGHGEERTELIRGVDLHVRRGERVGIVGESGSGKSLTISALPHMLPGVLHADTDAHVFLGHDLRGKSEQQLRKLIGAKMPMIFQDPMSSLNPALTIGRHMRDKLEAHTSLRGTAARDAAEAALERVGIPEPRRRLGQHPHELSGGQRQRVMIAMATLGDPHVILADEPTTALDVSVQAQVIDTLLDVSERDGVALVMVSHDLALVSHVCERIVVMYDGRIVEEGSTADVVGDPRHPYTRALLGAVPDLSRGTGHRLTTIDDYSWNTDEYRAANPVSRRGTSFAIAAAGEEENR